MISTASALNSASVAWPRSGGGPGSIGLELYQNYLLPFELTSLLLLVAMIGAVILTRDRGGRVVGGRLSKTAGPNPRAPLP